MVPPSANAIVVRYRSLSEYPPFKWTGMPSGFWKSFCSSGTRFLIKASEAEASPGSFVGVAKIGAGASG